MRYPGYFLIVWDFIRYAREQGIPVGPGRGSAAGSLVAYCLRITDVDPLQFDLIFERFLNPERVSLPDIDIDFCERRRGEVIDYVTRKYGRENVAQIITFGTMKARAVVRDVGRVLDIPFADVDRVAKAIPPALDMTLDKALEENPALKDLERRDERVTELLAVARRLEGMTRHASVHAAGVVIAPRPITEFAPLYKSQKDEITTQWAMKEIERIGLLKMDFLGLSTLTLIDDARHRDPAGRRARRSTSRPCRSTTRRPTRCSRTATRCGIFQFESSGMRDTLRKAKPQCLDDLIALNALYRPGPLRGGMVDDYIARKHGRVEVKYELPQLEPVLADTYGVIAYQEQVMRLASDLAGFTMGEADLLRKAMGKKNAAVMQAQRQRFVEGCGRAPHQHEEGVQDLRPDGVLRRVRLQQVALDDLRVPRVPDRLPEGQLPLALHGGAAHHRVAEHRQARPVPRRVPRDGRAHPAARPQRERAPLHRHRRRRALRPRRGEERGGGRHPLDARRAPGRRAHRLAVPAVRGRGPAAGQQARAREPRQGRRVRQPRGRRRRRRRRDRPGARRASRPPWTARSSTAHATSGTGTRARPSCSAARGTARPAPPSRCPPPSPGPRRSSWRSRRRRSAST